MAARFPLALCFLCLALISAAHAETRVALVVGNSAYVQAPALTNPANDARDMSASLTARGFDVVQAIDADKAKFDAALRTFASRVAKADVALFFYAGHGLQVGLQNYLVPIDAKLAQERDLDFEAVKLDAVLRQMELDRDGKTSIVLLDACRDNPLTRNLARSMGTRSAAIGRGLATSPAGLGTFIAFATQPGNVALDGAGRNSPFSTALLKHLPEPGKNLPALMIDVRKDVVATTNGQQVPWDHSALTQDFVFVPGTPQIAVAPAPASPASPPLEGAPALPPLQRKASTNQSAGRFLDAANVRLEGRSISISRQPNPEACRDLCDADGACVAYQHGRKIPVMGQCVIFSSLTTRIEDTSWRSGTKKAPAPAAAQIDSARGFVAVLSSHPVTATSRDDALKSYADIAKYYAGTLDGKAPEVIETPTSRGPAHRLIVSPPGPITEADAICTKLKSAGYSGCWVSAY